ncbi:hypothetical protein [Enhygromyxa salina]|nr:hypothetical protein [Enhygromyxa salina]
MSGDDYDDLAEAVLRGGIDGDGRLDGPQERFTVRLSSWDSMTKALLVRLVVEAGSLRRALLSVGIQSIELVDAWARGAMSGMSASVTWLAEQPVVTTSEPRVLTRSMRARRGDDYADLAEHASCLGLVGDGALDSARLRGRYQVERGPWLLMLGDLLGAVVADAGSVERAALVLAVPPAILIEWVRWFVSRGSIDAASSRWPIALPGDQVDEMAYADLLEAVERGAVGGENELDPPSVRAVYEVRIDSWERMEADLLGQIVADAGSIRRASKLIDMPRSTLGARLARARRRRP